MQLFSFDLFSELKTFCMSIFKFFSALLRDKKLILILKGNYAGESDAGRGSEPLDEGWVGHIDYILTWVICLQYFFALIVLMDSITFGHFAFPEMPEKSEMPYKIFS